MQNNIITSQNLNQPSSLIVPAQNPDLTPYASIIDGAITSLPNIQANVNQGQNTQNQLVNLLTERLSSNTGKTQYLSDQQNLAGVNTEQASLDALNSRFNDLGASLKGLSNEAKAIPLDDQNKATGLGITDAGLAPITTGRLRENAIKALTLSSEGDALSSRIANSDTRLLRAKEKAQQAVDLKYKPLEEDIARLQSFLDINQKYILDPAEKKRVETTNVALQERSRLLEEKKAQDKSKEDIIINAASQNAPSSLLVKARSAKTAGDAAVILGAYAGDYFKNQQLRIELNNLQKANLSSNSAIGSINKDMGVTLEDFKKGIAGVESEGSGGYAALGPVINSGLYKGDRAYGKYQVMGKNISQWSKEALGRSIGIQEFLNNPQLQETIFASQSEKNYAKYGNWDDVAAVWFSGKPATGNISSDGFNTVPEYITKYRNKMGVGTQINGNSLSSFTQPIQDAAKAIKAGTAKLESYASDDRLKITSALNALKNESAGTITPQLQPLVDKLTLLEKISTDTYLSSAVGTNSLGRTSFSNFATGGKDIFLSNVASLLDTQVLDNLIQAKANGATFGALSDAELNLLKNSASVLSKLADTDSNGIIVGYKGTEENFLNAIKDLQTKTRNALKSAGIDTNTLPKTENENWVQSGQNALFKTFNTLSKSGNQYGYK